MINKVGKIYFFLCIIGVCAILPTACTQTDIIPEYSEDLAVAFTSRTGSAGATRNGIQGPLDTDALRESSAGFSVFAYYTETNTWATAGDPIPNFMYNQQVAYQGAPLSRWTYSPVKYWPNDNQPADDEGATGSKLHSYLTFFAYAPYVQVPTPDAGLDLTGDASADGIVGITSNATTASTSRLRYRTSSEVPFSEQKSVDLLWAIPQRNRFKMDGGGYTTGHVDFVFKHALAKLGIYVKSLIDRTSQYTSPAYPTTLDENSRIFIESVNITTPPYYSEGYLLLAPTSDDTPKWDFTGFESKKFSGFNYDSTTGNTTEDVKYSMRWAAPNIPTTQPDAATAKADFDDMEAGVLDTPQQLGADHEIYLFPPSEEKREISVRAVYHVVTYDPSLTLNTIPYYSIVKNDITASLGNSDFLFEPNKQYKLVLNLGLTSVKFDIYVLDDRGEWILLSAVVKEWDLETKEANVE